MKVTDLLPEQFAYRQMVLCIQGIIVVPKLRIFDLTKLYTFGQALSYLGLGFSSHPKRLTVRIFIESAHCYLLVMPPTSQLQNA